MTVTDKKNEGIELWRRAIIMFNRCNEEWLLQFDEHELMDIVQAHFKHISNMWDIWPDKWTDSQVANLIDFGVVPRFKLNENNVLIADEDEDFHE